MIGWAGYKGLETLVPVDALVENLFFGVENIENRICIHLFTSCVNAYLEVRHGSFEKLFQKWTLEDSDLYFMPLINERGVKVWFSICSVDLIDLYINSGRSMNKRLVHVK